MLYAIQKFDKQRQSMQTLSQPLWTNITEMNKHKIRHKKSGDSKKKKIKLKLKFKKKKNNQRNLLYQSANIRNVKYIWKKQKTTTTINLNDFSMFLILTSINLKMKNYKLFHLCNYFFFANDCTNINYNITINYLLNIKTFSLFK